MAILKNTATAKILRFIPVSTNAQIDEQIVDSERAQALEKMADLDQLMLDLDRQLVHLIDDDESSA